MPMSAPSSALTGSRYPNSYWIFWPIRRELPGASVMSVP